MPSRLQLDLQARLKIRFVAGLAVLSFCGGCASSRGLLLRTDQPADVVRINPEESTSQNFGKTPTRLTDAQGTYLLTFTRPGFVPELLVIVEAEEAKGRIELKLQPLSDVAANVEAARQVDATLPKSSGRRLDTLLRAHRALLRGQLKESSELLTRLETAEGSDFGTLVLRANIAALNGNAEDARYFYESAKKLYPAFNAPKGGVLQ